MNTTLRPSWRKRLLQGAIFTALVAGGIAVVQLAPAAVAYAAGDVPGAHGPGAFDEAMRERHRARMHDHLQRVLADAGVSDAQQKKIDVLLQGAMEDQHADMERMHADMKLLKELLTAPTIDFARVNVVRAEQEQLTVQTTRRLTDVAVAIAQQLTPAQRQALGKEIDRMFEGHHGPFGHGPGPGPGPGPGDDEGE